MRKIVLLIALFVLCACSSPQTTQTSTPVAVAARQLAVTEPDCTVFRLERVGQDYHFICTGDTPIPTETAVPPTATHAHPTDTPAPPDTPTPPATSTPTAPIEPYADAPLCPPEAHDDRAWHTLWNAELGCHYDHPHGDNPHVLDDLFGTEYYTWAGGEISSPWQTFTGAGANHEHPGTEACMENDCKHTGNLWLVVTDYPCSRSVPGILNGAQNCITDARIQFHADLTQIDALVRFHSVWVEARVCNVGQTGPENCGIFKGGGHLDLGRLNIPRGTYVPLPNDPDIFMQVDFPPEAKFYRIHSICDGTRPDLDSWQSEGNWGFAVTDTPILSVGYGVHMPDPWGCVDPTMEGNPQTPENMAATDFFCYGEPGCTFNASEFSLFRVWVIIPNVFDNGQYDTDGRPGFFSYTGYTDRYGEVVEGCTEVGLDCVPVVASGVPVGRSRLRASELELNTDFDLYLCGDEVCTEGDVSIDWITP